MLPFEISVLEGGVGSFRELGSPIWRGDRVHDIDPWHSLVSLRLKFVSGCMRSKFSHILWISYNYGPPQGLIADRPSGINASLTSSLMASSPKFAPGPGILVRGHDETTGIATL